MTNSAEQIKEAPKPEERLQQESDGAIIAVIEDIDKETHGQIQEFYEILEEIKKRPDAETKVAQVIGMLRSLAGKTPDPDAEGDEGDDEEDGSPLKQAPAPSAALKQIFRNFRDATVALADSPECPRDVRDAISGMLDFFGDFHVAGHTTDARRARYVLACVFDLDDEEGGETPARETQAAREAPDGYWRILKNFRASTEAMINCAELPEHSRDAVLRMMGEFNGGADEREGEGEEPAATGPHKEIRAERFTLVGPDGSERGSLYATGDHAGLTLISRAGRTRMRIYASANEAQIVICGERGGAGKGVLPATDEVERVTIGYESAGQDARIVIKDGNENECVSLAIDNAVGDGFVHLTKPRDGYTLIDGRGLEVFDRDYNTLASLAAPEEAKGRLAASPTTEPTPIAADRETPKADPAPELKAERHVETECRSGSFPNPAQARGCVNNKAIRALVERIIHRDDDEGAKAFIALINAIAYDDSPCDRDSIALYACEAAYQRTRAFGDVAGEYFDAAASEFPLRAG